MAIPKTNKNHSKSNDDEVGVARNPFAVWVFLCAVIFVLFIFAALFYHFFLGGDIPWVALSNFDSAQYWGQLGDFAGGFLNPILSFLALMAVLKAMAIQRAEMKATQAEARAANLEQRVQSNLYSKQAFEATFFGLLEVHSRILKDILVQEGRPLRGRDAINAMLVRLKGNEDYKLDSNNPKLVVEKNVQEFIDEFCGVYRGQVGHYFRNLYWILKKIDSSRLGQDSEDQEKSARSRERRILFEYFRKREYASLVRAQLSEGELALLQLNCLGPDGEGLKYYVEKYSLLKPLNAGFFDGWSSYINGRFNRLSFKGGREIKMEELVSFVASEKLFRGLRSKAKDVTGERA